MNQRCARPADDRYRRFWRLPTEAELRGLETLLRDAEALRSVWVTTLPCEVCDRAATTPGAVAVEENGQPRLVPWMGGSIDGPAPTFVLAVRSSE